MHIENQKKYCRFVALAIALAATSGANAMEDDAIFNATRLEMDTGRANGGGNVQSIRGEGWIGTDYNRFAWKAEGAREHGTTSDVELQALYARYLAPFWELQMGVRHQDKPDSRNYVAVGVRGLAPYSFDVDLALFVRSDGKLFARTRAEYDLLWTNRLIFRPYAFADWSASHIAADDIKRGAESIEAGVNLRYEISRAVAPYVEVARNQRYAISGRQGISSVRLGLRLLF